MPCPLDMLSGHTDHDLSSFHRLVQGPSDHHLKQRESSSPQKFRLFQNIHLAEEENRAEKSRGHPGPGLLPTFVGVIQLEDIGVLGVVRQLHHPAHNGDFFAGCGFILGKNNSITQRPMPSTPRRS